MGSDQGGLACQGGRGTWSPERVCRQGVRRGGLWWPSSPWLGAEAGGERQWQEVGDPVRTGSAGGRRAQRGQSGEGSRKEAGRAGLLRGSGREESSGQTAVPAGRRGRSQRQGACRGQGDEKRRRGEVRPPPRVTGLDPSSFLHSHVALLPGGRRPAAGSAGHSRERPRAGR